MPQSELKDLLDHLKSLGVVQASITQGDLRIEVVFEVDPFDGIADPAFKTPTGDDWS